MARLRLGSPCWELGDSPHLGEVSKAASEKGLLRGEGNRPVTGEGGGYYEQKELYVQSLETECGACKVNSLG